MILHLIIRKMSYASIIQDFGAMKKDHINQLKVCIYYTMLT